MSPPCSPPLICEWGSWYCWYCLRFVLKELVMWLFCQKNESHSSELQAFLCSLESNPAPRPVFSWKTQQSKLRGLKQSQHYSLLMTLHLLAYNGAPQSKLWPCEANFYHLWTLRESVTAGIITNKMRSNFSISPYLLFTLKHLIQGSLFPESFSHISLWI